MTENIDTKKEDFFFAQVLFGIGMILIGLAEVLTNGWLYQLLGVYAWYRGLLELTFYKNGFNMPNAWKIVVITIIMMGLNAMVFNYLTIEAIMKLLELFAGGGGVVQI